MKKMVKVILAAAAIIALAAPAMAAPGDLKLKVRDDGNTADVFTVSNTGVVQVGTGTVTGAKSSFNNTNGKFGFGTLIPQTSLHLVEASNPPDRGLTIGQYGDHKGAALIYIQKAGGTQAAPTKPLSGANVAAFHGAVWNGTAYSSNASLMFATEAGDYSSGLIPMSVAIATSNGTLWSERFKVSSNGTIKILNQPTAPANTATCAVGDMILDAPNGYWYLCTATNTWKRTTFATY